MNLRLTPSSANTGTEQHRLRQQSQPPVPAMSIVDLALLCLVAMGLPLATTSRSDMCIPLTGWQQRVKKQLNGALHCQDHVSNILLTQLGPHYRPNKYDPNEYATVSNGPLVFFFAGGPGIGKTDMDV